MELKNDIYAQIFRTKRDGNEYFMQESVRYMTIVPMDYTKLFSLLRV